MGGQTVDLYGVVWDAGFERRRGTITRFSPQATTNSPAPPAQTSGNTVGEFYVEWADAEHNSGQVYLRDDQAATPQSVWTWLMSHGYPTESHSIWMASGDEGYAIVWGT